MSLHLENEIPNLQTAFGILEAEGIIHTVRFGPNNECVCKRENEVDWDDKGQ